MESGGPILDPYHTLSIQIWPKWFEKWKVKSGFWLNKSIFTLSSSILGLRWAYIGGQLILCLGMAALSATSNLYVAFVGAVTMGIAYVTTFTMPYILITEYHADIGVCSCYILLLTASAMCDCVDCVTLTFMFTAWEGSAASWKKEEPWHRYWCGGGQQHAISQPDLTVCSAGNVD